MPTWLAVLLLMPIALWAAYCVLSGVFRLPSCSYCGITWIVLLEGLGVWLVWSGLVQEIEVRVVFGATLLVTVNLIFGLLFVVGRWNGKKRARQSRESAKDGAIAAAAVTATAVGAAQVERSDVADNVSESELGNAAGDIGIDV